MIMMIMVNMIMIQCNFKSHIPNSSNHSWSIVFFFCNSAVPTCIRVQASQNTVGNVDAKTIIIAFIEIHTQNKMQLIENIQ